MWEKPSADLELRCSSYSISTEQLTLFSTSCSNGFCLTTELLGKYYHFSKPQLAETIIIFISNLIQYYHSLVMQEGQVHRIHVGRINIKSYKKHHNNSWSQIDISHHKQTTHFRSSNDLQSKYDFRKFVCGLISWFASLHEAGLLNPKCNIGI